MSSLFEKIVVFDTFFLKTMIWKLFVIKQL